MKNEIAIQVKIKVVPESLYCSQFLIFHCISALISDLAFLSVSSCPTPPYHIFYRDML